TAEDCWSHPTARCGPAPPEADTYQFKPKNPRKSKLNQGAAPDGRQGKAGVRKYELLPPTGAFLTSAKPESLVVSKKGRAVAIRVVRLGSQRVEDEGVRIGTVR